MDDLPSFFAGPGILPEGVTSLMGELEEAGLGGGDDETFGGGRGDADALGDFFGGGTGGAVRPPTHPRTHPPTRDHRRAPMHMCAFACCFAPTPEGTIPPSPPSS